MGGTVQTGERPITVDKTDDEGNAVLWPSGRVDEGGKDESG